MRYPLLVALLVPAFFACVARAAENEPPPRLINTTGEATVYVKPDEVIVNLGVETFHRNLDESKSMNDAASKKLLAAVRDVGVEDKHVQTDVMQVQIDYPDGGAKNGIDGYICRRSYAVTLKDTAKFEKLIDAALKNGANNLMGFEFKTTELRKHRDQARKLAIKAAKEKAIALADELGMSVTTPRTINEGGGGYYGYTGSYWGWGGGWRGGNFSQNAIQQAPSGGGEGGETLPLGQIAVRAQVSVSFDMATK